jgi:hypothetical protein
MLRPQGVFKSVLNSFGFFDVRNAVLGPGALREPPQSHSLEIEATKEVAPKPALDRAAIGQYVRCPAKAFLQEIP